jgi:hypothetical protein
MRHGSRRLNTTTLTTTSYERPPFSEGFGCAIAFCGSRPFDVYGLGPGDYNHNDDDDARNGDADDHPGDDDDDHAGA